MPFDSIRVECESAADVREELSPIMQENWSAVQTHYPTSRLRPNYALYMQLAEQGKLRVYIARDEGEIVGYALVLISEHPHRVEDLCAMVDTIFVSAKRRSHGAARRMLQTIETDLRAAGAYSIVIGSRDPRVGRWLHMQGFSADETMWQKVL